MACDTFSCGAQALRAIDSTNMQTNDETSLTVGLAQIAPVWLDRARTLEKAEAYIDDAGAQYCGLVVFGEALVPG
jgi:nitrilase